MKFTNRQKYINRLTDMVIAVQQTLNDYGYNIALSVIMNSLLLKNSKQKNNLTTRKNSDDINHVIYVMNILNAAQGKLNLQEYYTRNINETMKTHHLLKLKNIYFLTCKRFKNTINYKQKTLSIQTRQIKQHK